MMKQKQDENGLQTALQELYDNTLPQPDVDDAARNLVGLFEVLLEIHEGCGYAAGE
jgi:hypothetical protein